MSKDYRNISKKIQGYFFYKGQDDKNIFLEHIASGKQFHLTKKSFEHPGKLKEIDNIIFIGFVKWKGEWWYSGFYTQILYDADLVAKEKNSVKSKINVSFLDYENEKEKFREILQSQYKTFKIFNNGYPIAFMPVEKIQSFINEFLNFSYQNFMKKLKKKAQKKIFNDTNNIEDIAKTEETGLIFFNPETGIEIAFGINSAFLLPNNKYYNEEKSTEHVIELLMS